MDPVRIAPPRSGRLPLTVPRKKRTRAVLVDCAGRRSIARDAGSDPEPATGGAPDRLGTASRSVVGAEALTAAPVESLADARNARDAHAAASTVDCPGAAVLVDRLLAPVPSGSSIWTTRLPVSPCDRWRIPRSRATARSALAVTITATVLVPRSP